MFPPSYRTGFGRAYLAAIAWSMTAWAVASSVKRRRTLTYMRCRWSVTSSYTIAPDGAVRIVEMT